LKCGRGIVITTFLFDQMDFSSFQDLIFHLSHNNKKGGRRKRKEGKEGDFSSMDFLSELHS